MKSQEGLSEALPGRLRVRPSRKRAGDLRKMSQFS